MPIFKTFNQYFDTYYDVRKNPPDDVSGFEGANRYHHTELTQMAQKLNALKGDWRTLNQMGFQRYQRVSNSVHEMLAATAAAAHGMHGSETDKAREELWSALEGLRDAFRAATKRGNDGVDDDYPRSLRKLINTYFDHQHNDANGPNGLSGYPNPFSSEELQEITALLNAAKKDVWQLSDNQLLHVYELRSHLVLRAGNAFHSGMRSGWQVEDFNDAWKSFLQAFRDARAERQRAEAFLTVPTTPGPQSGSGLKRPDGQR